MTKKNLPIKHKYSEDFSRSLNNLEKIYYFEKIPKKLGKELSIQLEKRKRNEIYKKLEYFFPFHEIFDCLSYDASNCFQIAKKLTHQWNKTEIGGGDLLLAIMNSKTFFLTKLFERYGITNEKIEREYVKLYPEAKVFLFPSELSITTKLLVYGLYPLKTFLTKWIWVDFKKIIQEKEFFSGRNFSIEIKNFFQETLHFSRQKYSPIVTIELLLLSFLNENDGELKFIIEKLLDNNSSKILGLKYALNAEIWRQTTNLLNSIEPCYLKYMYYLQLDLPNSVFERLIAKKPELQKTILNYRKELIKEITELNFEDILQKEKELVFYLNKFAKKKRFYKRTYIHYDFPEELEEKT
jgi:hypothetical protein